MVRNISRSLLRELYRSMIAYGSIHTGTVAYDGTRLVLPADLGAAVPSGVPDGTGPSGRHPEVVRPELPLTPVERALEDDLMSR
jgi:hypothetical protein